MFKFFTSLFAKKGKSKREKSADESNHLNAPKLDEQSNQENKNAKDDLIVVYNSRQLENGSLGYQKTFVPRSDEQLNQHIEKNVKDRIYDDEYRNSSASNPNGQLDRNKKVKTIPIDDFFSNWDPDPRYANKRDGNSVHEFRNLHAPKINEQSNRQNANVKNVPANKAVYTAVPWNYSVQRENQTRAYENVRSRISAKEFVVGGTNKLDRHLRGPNKPTKNHQINVSSFSQAQNRHRILNKRQENMSLPKNPKPARERSPVDPLCETKSKRRKTDKSNDSLKKEDETLNNEKVKNSTVTKISKAKKPKLEAKKKVSTRGKGTKKQVQGSQGGCSSICEDETSILQDDFEENHVILPQPTTSNASASPSSIQMRWREDELLAEIQDLERHVAKNIIKLFDEENTIPFIARYRKDMTGDMDPDKLRKVRQSYEYVRHILQKAQNLMKQISAQGKLNDDVSSSICSARSLLELESIGSQFKTGSKRTLAERAKELGLEPPGKNIFLGTEDVNAMSLVRSDVDGLQNAQKVQEGLRHIIADIISKHEDVLAGLKKIYNSREIKLESTGKKIDKGSPRAEKISKYDLYLDFKSPVKYIKPYQVLAINRAESQKLVTVKISIPDFLWENLKNDCCKKWFRNGISSPLRTKLILESFDDAIHRLITPMVVRHIRSQLNEQAETESINVFVQNLRNLLMTRPLRGKVVCAIDPGFKNGCKVAIVSQSGIVQQFMKIFLPQVSRSSDRDAENFRNLLTAFNCDTIALGNGTACRETESFLNDLIGKGFFEPLKVRYTIVDEQGVSIYSCSPLASEEFPGVDPNFISAASLARRLQDPLSELVKVEPKHLGVGMYQHDISEKKLTAALGEVVSECVSFVGVDINTCSIYLLKRVAGLNESKAKNIVEWRLTNGPFRSRADLKKVKLIGDKSFQQCAGFIRIIPSTAEVDELAPGSKNKSKRNGELNPLDKTWIHPESYEVANGVLNELGLNLKDLGSDPFIRKVQETTRSVSVENLAAIFGVSSVMMKLIVDAFSVSSDHDLRMLSESAPLFREGITTFESLSVGATLSGVVRNVVHFGAFVDIGIGKDALLHNSGMKGKVVKLNDRVSVLVSKIVPEKRNINLQLLSVN